MAVQHIPGGSQHQPPRSTAVPGIHRLTLRGVTRDTRVKPGRNCRNYQNTEPEQSSCSYNRKTIPSPFTSRTTQRPFSGSQSGGVRPLSLHRDQSHPCFCFLRYIATWKHLKVQIKTRFFNSCPSCERKTLQSLADSGLVASDTTGLSRLRHQDLFFPPYPSQIKLKSVNFILFSRHTGKHPKHSPAINI